MESQISNARPGAPANFYESHNPENRLLRADFLRIVLSNIGTLGDIHPLIAIALELKRRGHVPVMAVPEVFRAKIVPLGLEFHAVRPDIDPENKLLAAMVYDVKKGTERG